jgi:hypothetical protein
MTMTALAIPELGPEVRAKRDGTCHFCAGSISAGEDYIRKAGKRWGHAICATDYVRVLEEHEIDGADDGASEETQ